MRKVLLAVAVILCALSLGAAETGQSLLLDDFESNICGGPEGTVDFGAGGASKVDVTAATDIKYSGRQSLKVDFEAVPGGYMWVARGFGLDSKNTAWLIKPEDIDWKVFNTISFYMYGTNSAARVAVDLKDSTNEIYRYHVDDDFSGWKQIVVPLADFYPRGDWQPEGADKNNQMDFPLKSYQFEPRAEAKGTLYFDQVELLKK